MAIRVALRAFARTLLFAACFSTAACSSDDGSGGSKSELRTGSFLALTYNVAGLPQQLSGSEPQINTPLISPLLNDYDLVLVQEDWLAPDPNPFEGTFDVYHDLLAANAEHPYQSVPAPLPLGMDPSRPTALMSDGLNEFSQFPFGDLTRVAWDACFGSADQSDGGAADCMAFKGFSMATHTFDDGVEVDIYDLHGEAGATEEDQNLSAADFEQLAAFIDERSAGHAVIVGGDTNLHAGDGHPDGWGDGDTNIWNSFLAASGLADVCSVVDGCELSIDKFAFKSSDALEIEPLSHTIEREKFTRDDGTPLSDHDPTAVEFSWTVRDVTR